MSRYRVAAVVAAVLVIMIDVALLDTPVTSPISATALAGIATAVTLDRRSRQQ